MRGRSPGQGSSDLLASLCIAIAIVAVAVAGCDAGGDASAGPGSGTSGDESADAAGSEASDTSADTPGQAEVGEGLTDDGAAPAGPELIPMEPPARAREISVIQVLNFAAEDPPGVAFGLNLDGLETAEGDPTGCGQGDFTGQQGTAGVDNAFARVLPPLEASMGSNVNQVVREAVATGEVLLLLVVDGIDDPLNDEHVSVGIYRADGKPALGTDGRVLAGQTFDLALDQPFTRTEHGSIVDGVVSAGPLKIVLSLDFFDTHVDLTMDLAHVEYRLEPDGTFHGVLGAVSHKDKLIKMVGDLDADFIPAAELLLGEFADLDTDEDGTCDALSMGVEILGARAHIYPDLELPR